MNLNRKKLSKIHAERMTLDRILFGSDVAPTPELQSERVEMVQEFRAALEYMGETNASKLLSFLREERATYDPVRDRGSKMMMLVDRIEEHKRKELHASNAATA